MERGYFQQRAELSRFDDSAVQERRQKEKFSTSKGMTRTAAVPGTDAVVYDPSHHAADYAGLVSRDVLERTHFQGVAQQHVAPSHFGYITPAEDVPTLDHVAGAGRKHYENDVRFQSREVVPGSAPLFADPTYFVQGGQDSRFESTAMAMAKKSQTGQHEKHSSGKKHVIPSFEAAQRSRSSDPRHLSDVTNNETQLHPGGRARQGSGFDTYAREAPVERGDLVNYRATAFKVGAPSLLSGLGSAVAKAKGGEGRSFSLENFPDRPRHRETIEAVRGREKGTHLLDGGSGGRVPGYTGRAK